MNVGKKRDDDTVSRYGRDLLYNNSYVKSVIL